MVVGGGGESGVRINTVNGTVQRRDMFLALASKHCSSLNIFLSQLRYCGIIANYSTIIIMSFITIMRVKIRVVTILQLVLALGERSPPPPPAPQ